MAPPPDGLETRFEDQVRRRLPGGVNAGFAAGGDRVERLHLLVHEPQFTLQGETRESGRVAEAIRSICATSRKKPSSMPDGGGVGDSLRTLDSRQIAL